MRGRPPKPSVLKLVAGNPGKRKLNQNEPKPPDLVCLSAPVWLPAAAKAVWEELAPGLARQGLLTVLDGPLLALGCVSIAQCRLAGQVADQQLVTSKTVVGEAGPVEVGAHLNPWLLAQSMAMKQATAVLLQFGMSPTARARVATAAEGDPDGNSKKGTFFKKT